MRIVSIGFRPAKSVDEAETQLMDTQVEDAQHDSASSTAGPESGDVSERQQDCLDSSFFHTLKTSVCGCL